MQHIDDGSSGARPEQVAAAIIGAFMIYILIVGLEGTGRHFLELGAIRVVLFVALLTFARWSGALTRRLGKFAIGLNAASAVAFVGGAVGAVLTDGWAYDIFADTAPVEPPAYAYVIGLSGILFALSTILVGVSGRSAGRLAVATIAAGATFPLAFALGPTMGHAVWLTPWLALSVGLSVRLSDRLDGRIAAAAPQATQTPR